MDFYGGTQNNHLEEKFQFENKQAKKPVNMNLRKVFQSHG